MGSDGHDPGRAGHDPDLIGHDHRNAHPVGRWRRWPAQAARFR